MARRIAEKGVAEASGAIDLFAAAGDVGKSRTASDAANQGTAPGVDGHRNRMRARLLAAGPEALADHEMLEMLLFLALPRRDTKPIARELLARFGGVRAGGLHRVAVRVARHRRF